MKCHELGGVRIKCKKISVIILLLLFSLLMIGAVSAASDANATAISSDVSDTHTTHTDTNTQVDKTNSNNNNANINEDITTDEKSSTNTKIKTENTKLSTTKNDKLKENDETSFKSLNKTIYDNINTGTYTIDLKSNYTYQTNDGEDLKKGITIDGTKLQGQTLTINGNGHTINGSNEARIFKVTNGAQLKLINITLTKGKGQNDGPNGYNVGGAIYATDNCNITITDSKITHNTAEHFGGAIYTYNSQINIKNTNINNNTANNGVGGAIYTQDNSQININNTNITHNNATYYGGAIYTQDNSQVNINNTNITHNNATWGGAIYTQDNSQVNINNTNITHNNATRDGGAIYTSNSQININNTNITHNNATLYGGAIYTYNSQVNMSYTSFIKNTAKGTDTYDGGGAIYANYDSIMVVSSSLFMDNTASNNGGAIYGRNFKNLTVNNNIFLNNTGNKEIYLSKYRDVDFYYDLGCNWFGNNETDHMNKPDTVQLEDTTSTPSVLRFDNWLFLNATSPDTPVTVLSTNNITFKLSLYNQSNSGNEASEYDNTLLYPVDLMISYVKATGVKSAKLGEKIIYTPTDVGTSVTASIENVKYTQQIKTKYPILETSFTALYNDIMKSENGQINLNHNYTYDDPTDGNLIKGIPITKKITINGNGYTINGLQNARIFNITNNGDLTLINTTLTQGKGQLETIQYYWTTLDQIVGGAIYTEGNLTILNTTLTQNTAKDTMIGPGYYQESLGGAIYAYENSNVNIINSKITQNTVKVYGGAIYAYKSNINITSSNFTHNNATANDGGAIYAITDCTITITDSNFTQNTANGEYGNGGAIYTVGNCNINITSSNFTQNTANGEQGNGGAIYTHYNCNVNITGSNFTHNKAKLNGGVIYTENACNLNITGSNFTQNTATIGGVIYTENACNLNITGSLFTKNTANNQGNSIYILNINDLKVNHSIFLNNTGSTEFYNETALTNYNIDYNWFGNTADNYTTKPNIGLDLNNWLFLNAASTPDPVTISSTNNITFELSLYTNEISDYDDNLLYPIDLMISYVNGTGVKNAKLGEKAIYTPNIGTGSVTASIENIKYTQKINAVLETSFTALYNNITNSQTDTLTLTHNYTYDDRTDKDLITGIPINKTITINGNGYTINGSNEARIFNVTNGAQLKLTNITLTKGKGQDDGPNNWNVGGAIYATDNCNIIITDSKITHNNADHGGAILACDNSQINITNTNINNNNANNGNGGAIYTYNSQINITHTNITQNNADHGGAIYTENSHINITHTNINNNNANNGDGGAIYTYNSQINITHTNITQNNAMAGGAILACDNSQVNMSYTSFIKNTAKGTYTYDGGGAIYASYDSIMVVSSSLFMDNTASNNGSAIYGYDFKNLTVNNNIFLNNTGTNIIYLYKSYGSEFNYDLEFNWFANNDTNYKDLNNEGIVGIYGDNLKLDSWLFLKATNTTDKVTLFNTSNITFKLDLYNSTTTASNEVSDYDNTQLYPINLNITSLKGTVDKKTASLNETIKYNATEGGKGSVTARIESASCTIELTNNEIPTEIRVNNNTLDLKVDDTFQLIPTTTPEGLDVTFVQDDSGVYIVDENGVVTALKNGTGSVLVKVGGDGVYAENSTTVTVNVKKIPTTINLDKDEINLNVTDSVVSGATLDPSEAGSLTYMSNDSSVAKVVDGNIIGISQGYANITVSYKGNNKYENATNKTILVTVNLKELTTNITNINIPSDLFEGKQYNVTGILKVNDTQGFADQEITITISNADGYKEMWTGKTDNTGKFNIKIKPQVNGEVNITINYPGNQTQQFLYKPVTKTQKQTVTLNKTSFKYLQQQIIDAIQNNQNNLTLEWDYKYDEDTDYEYIKGININNEFTIYGNNHTINASGQARIFHVNKTGNLTLDNITLCNGMGQDETINGETVNVAGAIYAENNLTITNSILQDNNAQKGSGIYIINGTLTTINTQFINSNVDGQNYQVKHKDSQLKIETITDITEGNTLTIKISADPLFNDNVTLNINGNNYNVEIINGQGQISIPNLKPGTYTAKLIFKGNDNYTEINVTSNSFKVNSKPVDPTPTPAPVGKQNTKILAKNKIYKPAKYRTYTVTVKNSKGKLVKNTRVKLKIGKKTYTSKTNSKGVATFKIPNKKSKKTKKSTKKSYKITATLNKNAKKDKLTLKMGTKTYNTKTNNNGKGTFKVKTSKKKIRKYVVTLKTTSGQVVKKQKVTLKVNKKTYKATTNSKGKATFKINNLNKKGKYKAKITYKGNNQYNKSNKNVKITIKE